MLLMVMMIMMMIMVAAKMALVMEMIACNQRALHRRDAAEMMSA